MDSAGTIFIIDDDRDVREALTSLFEAAGYLTDAYPDAETFLAAYERDRPGCLVLDMQMPGMGGLGLQKVLAERKDRRPIIFLTAHGTVPLTVRALKNGALDFLEKPAEGRALLDLVSKALQRDEERRREAAKHDLALRCCSTLTRREREILRLVVAGNSNKDIANQLGISHRTVELHRMRIMHKTGAQNVVELVNIALTAGLAPDPSPGNDTLT